MLLAVSQGQPSLIEELWNYFVNEYFTLKLPYFENFSIKTDGLVNISGILIGLMIGIVIAAGCSIYNKRYVGNFVRHVLYNDCLDHKSAKTLYELGYHKSPTIRSLVKSGTTLSRWVRCVEEDLFLEEVEKKRVEFEELHKDDEKPPKFKVPEFKRDPDTMHFYIPEEKKYAADVKFDAKGANVFTFIIVLILAVVLCGFLFYILPDILKMIDNFITIFSK